MRKSRPTLGVESVPGGLRGAPYVRKAAVSFIATFVVLATLAAISYLPANAQAIYGSIIGTVSDASGSLVPSATVKVTSLGTNEVRTATTSAAGNY